MFQWYGRTQRMLESSYFSGMWCRTLQHVGTRVSVKCWYLPPRQDVRYIFLIFTATKISSQNAKMFENNEPVWQNLQGIGTTWFRFMCTPKYSKVHRRKVRSNWSDVCPPRLLTTIPETGKYSRQEQMFWIYIILFFLLFNTISIDSPG
jgi:hypothetical protein